MSANELLSAPVGRKIADAPLSLAHIRARRGWNTVLGTEAMGSKNWRMAFFIMSFVAVLCASAAWHFSHLPSPPPLIVDRTTDGSTHPIGYAGTSNYKANVNDYRASLARWIGDVRGLSSDPIMVKDKWSDAYTFMSPQAKQKLNVEANADDSVQKLVGQVTISVQIDSVVPISDSSYEGRWTQTSYNATTGNVTDRSTWTATFQVSQREMASDDPASMVNGTGITIDDFAWHRDLSTRN